MCRPPRPAVNADERTARRSVPATSVGCVVSSIDRNGQISAEEKRFEMPIKNIRGHLFADDGSVGLEQIRESVA